MRSGKVIDIVAAFVAPPVLLDIMERIRDSRSSRAPKRFLFLVRRLRRV